MLIEVTFELNVVFKFIVPAEIRAFAETGPLTVKVKSATDAKLSNVIGVTEVALAV
jgi:hypothetical protein